MFKQKTQQNKTNVSLMRECGVCRRWRRINACYINKCISNLYNRRFDRFQLCASVCRSSTCCLRSVSSRRLIDMNICWMKTFAKIHWPQVNFLFHRSKNHKYHQAFDTSHCDPSPGNPSHDAHSVQSIFIFQKASNIWNALMHIENSGPWWKWWKRIVCSANSKEKQRTRKKNAVECWKCTAVLTELVVRLCVCEVFPTKERCLSVHLNSYNK